MIEFYPSKLDGAPCETYPDGPSGTIESWLLDNVPTYRPELAQRISARLNGVEVPHCEWSATAVSPRDLLQLYAEPKGAELIIAAVTLAAAVTFVSSIFTPNLPGANGNKGKSGSSLDSADVKGNQVKLNDPIREVAGQRWIYPDYILPPHRYFNAPREQVVELLLSVGAGKFDIPLSRVLIGDTPAISLGSNVDFAIFNPGDSVAGRNESQWWHSAPEVGGTSVGTAGMELVVITAATPSASAQTYVFSGDTVTVPSGAGGFPDDWENGMIVRIEAGFPYTVTDGGAGRDVISGDIASLGLSAGDLIEISGDNPGDYIVAEVDNLAGVLKLDYSNGDPAIALQTGNVSMGIGYRGLRWRILAASTASLTLQRLTDTGATDSSWPGFPNATIPDAAFLLDESNLSGNWCGPFAACPEGETTTEIEYDLFAPSGLIRIGSKGQVLTWSVGTELQYRDIATAGAWTSVLYTVSGRTQNQVGWTRKVTLPYAMRPEIRMRRTRGRSTIPNIAETIQWYGLRAKLSAPTSYPVTTLAMRIVTTDTLSSQAESLVSVRATRIIETLEGVEATSRNPADFLRYIAHSVGYTDDDLDMAELERLGELWATRGDYFDNIFDTNTTVFDAMTDVLRVGFAVPSIDGGVIRPVRDEPRTAGQFDGSYSPQNLTQPLTRGFSAITPDDPDGVDVEYYDETGRQWLTVQCRLPGDTGTRVEKLRVPGVTDKTRAWRIGMRRRRELAYRRKTYQLNTEMDGLNDGYWSYVALSDDIPGYSQSAIVEGYNATTRRLTVSEPLQWVDGADHVVGVRRPNGSLNGPIAVTRVDDYTMQLADPLDFAPVLDLSIDPPYIQFGTLATWAYPALISSLTPTGTTGVTIEAVNYDARVYEDDDNSPP